MNKKVTPLSFINLILVFAPWSILYLRQYDFALKSPNAEIIITAYCIFIIAAFLFSLVLYTKKKQRDILTSVALIINGLYAAGVVGIVCMSIPTWIK